MFYVGQKVVCVDDKPQEPYSTWNNGGSLEEGIIYTIRGVGTTIHKTPGVRLFEVKLNPTQFPHLQDLCYRATRFKPLVEKKTDISIFQRMLTERLVPIDEQI